MKHALMMILIYGSSAVISVWLLVALCAAVARLVTEALQ